MPARLPRLDGVEHHAGCPAARRSLLFAGSSTRTEDEVTVTEVRARCPVCGLSVILASSLRGTPGQEESDG